MGVPWKEEIWGRTPTKACNCKLLLTPGEYKRLWNEERFRLLPNYFGPCNYYYFYIRVFRPPSLRFAFSCLAIPASLSAAESMMMTFTVQRNRILQSSNPGRFGSKVLWLKYITERHWHIEMCSTECFLYTNVYFTYQQFRSVVDLL